MLLLLPFAAVVQTPPVQTRSVAPPAPVIVGNRLPSRTITFAVTVRHGDQTLWEGRLAMSTAGTATISQRRDQTVACPSIDPRQAVGRFSSGFSVSLYPSYGTADGAQGVRMTARLDRPATDGPLTKLCDDQAVRSVEVQANFAPVTGKPITIQGDAGFVITLVPRLEPE